MSTEITEGVFRLEPNEVFVIPHETIRFSRLSILLSSVGLKIMSNEILRLTFEQNYFQQSGLAVIGAKANPFRALFFLNPNIGIENDLTTSSEVILGSKSCPNMSDTSSKAHEALGLEDSDLADVHAKLATDPDLYLYVTNCDHTKPTIVTIA